MRIEFVSKIYTSPSDYWERELARSVEACCAHDDIQLSMFPVNCFYSAGGYSLDYIWDELNLQNHKCELVQDFLSSTYVVLTQSFEIARSWSQSTACDSKLGYYYRTLTAAYILKQER